MSTPLKNVHMLRKSQGKKTKRQPQVRGASEQQKNRKAKPPRGLTAKSRQTTPKHLSRTINKPLRYTAGSQVKHHGQ